MRFVIPCFALLSFISLASAQSTKPSKNPDAPAMLTTAQFVFVEPYVGSIYDASTSPEDRDAVNNVVDALHDWGYYKLALRAKQADLIIMVRTGRSSRSYSGIHVQTGRTDPNAPSPPGTGLGGREGVAAGPDEDLFWVYWQKDGKLNGPIWQQNLKNGLDGPTPVLFQNLKEAVIARIAEQAKKKTTPNNTP